MGGVGVGVETETRNFGGSIKILKGARKVTVVKMIMMKENII